MDVAMETSLQATLTHSHHWNAILVIILIWNAYGFVRKIYE